MARSAQGLLVEAGVARPCGDRSAATSCQVVLGQKRPGSCLLFVIRDGFLLVTLLRLRLPGHARSMARSAQGLLLAVVHVCMAKPAVKVSMSGVLMRGHVHDRR